MPYNQNNNEDISEISRENLANF